MAKFFPITSSRDYDDGDTSFELDEPDDEEIFHKTLVDEHEQYNELHQQPHRPLLLTNGYAIHIADPLAAQPLEHKSRRGSGVGVSVCGGGVGSNAYDRIKCHTATEYSRSFATPASTLAMPVVAIKDDDSGEQSDASLESHTDSSTPTTADVADLTVAMMLTCSPSPSPSPHAMEQHKRLSSLYPGHCSARHLAATHNQQLSINNSNVSDSIADDNISGSIATTTTEIEMDAISASPHMSRLLATPVLLELSPSKSPNRPRPIVNQSAHPSAAIRETDAVDHNAATANNTNYMADNLRRTLSGTSHRSNGSHHPSMSSGQGNPRSRLYNWISWICIQFKSSGIGEPSVYHALVVIFLEFFAWGLLAMPVIAVLNQTFPDHTFLMNGLVMGIKGILSFLSAPLIGALSDIWGRKFFLLITVFFTCAPIPLMTINTWWFFAMISISGVFAVTFSVVFAYVADVTTVDERSRAYGLVSATFAASLVISPALGALLMETYSDTLVVALATAIAVLDVFFILVAVPESLPEKVRPSSWGAPISWEQADPFAALRKVGSDHTILMQCVTVLLSYLPEAGQYSCIFVYLKLKMGFNSMEVAVFIAVVGTLSISVQVTLGYLMRALGAKRTIIVGLVLEMMQLLWYGFGSQAWMMWAAGVLAALGSITYPAISAFVSIHSNADRQGAVQGMVTGMRGLCNGLGPAMFGVIFYLFNVDLTHGKDSVNNVHEGSNGTNANERFAQLVPGPPFVFGALMVLLAILVAIFIPEAHAEINPIRVSNEKKRVSLDVQYEVECGHKSSSPLSPLMRSDSMAQL